MKIGQEFKVTFWDHVQDDDNLIKCVVYGKLIKQDKDKIVLCSWDILHSDHGLVKQNRLIFTLIRSAIIDCEEIHFF